jgi:sugar phosphate isomerase/epimerase
MKLAFLFYEPIPDLRELSRRMSILAQLGYEGVELTAIYPPPYSAEDLQRVAQEHQLPVVSFLSGWSYANEHLCLSSRDPAVRERAVVRLVSYAEYAAHVGAHVVVGLMQGFRSDEPNEKLAVPRIRECLQQAARQAEACGGRFVLEPVNHLQVGFHHTADEAAALVAQVESPAPGYMLDTIHVHIEERSMVDTIRKHGGSIRHFHLCESNGGPFGTGSVDVPLALSTLEAAGYDQFVSVKIYRHLDWQEAARTAAEYLLPQLQALRRK